MSKLTQIAFGWKVLRFEWTWVAMIFFLGGNHSVGTVDVPCVSFSSPFHSDRIATIIAVFFVTWGFMYFGSIEFSRFCWSSPLVLEVHKFSLWAPLSHKVLMWFSHKLWWLRVCFFLRAWTANRRTSRFICRMNTYTDTLTDIHLQHIQECSEVKCILMHCNDSFFLFEGASSLEISTLVFNSGL